jgi:hypothetical protein
MFCEVFFCENSLPFLKETELRDVLGDGKMLLLKLRGFSPQANYTDQATAACHMLLRVT